MNNAAKWPVPSVVYSATIHFVEYTPGANYWHFHLKGIKGSGRCPRTGKVSISAASELCRYLKSQNRSNSTGERQFDWLINRSIEFVYAADPNRSAPTVSTIKVIE